MKEKKNSITGNNVSNSPLFPFHFLSFFFIYTPEKYNFHPKIRETFFVYCDVKHAVFNALIASSKTPSFSFHLFFHVSSQFNPQISKTGPSLDTKGLTLTHKRVKMEASKIDQTKTMVGILSCFPSKPLRNG